MCLQRSNRRLFEQEAHFHTEGIAYLYVHPVSNSFISLNYNTLLVINPIQLAIIEIVILIQTTIFHYLKFL